MFPAGKRQWQRMVDAGACEKRQRDEEDEDAVITDKTRLLLSSLEGSEHPVFPEACANVPVIDPAPENEISSQLPWKHDTASMEPRLSSVDLSEPEHGAESTRPSFPLRKSCSHASWQGFKQLVKKQFMPSFPFRKDMPLEEMPPLQQRRMEGAMNRASRVLGASTNLVELRKLDAKIQNGRNKSAFVPPSSKGSKSKENLAWGSDQNLDISKAVKLSSLSETSLNVVTNDKVVKMKPRRSGGMSSSLTKENSILGKLKRQVKKDDVLLLANARD